jgi:sugar lactone lactonase YvrE
MPHANILSYPRFAYLLNSHSTLIRNSMAMLLATLVLILAGCGGGGSEHKSAALYTINGQLSGLADGQQVTLLNNGGNAITMTANGAFTFTTPVAYGASYNVTVSTQPTGQTCSVANNSGAGAGVNADVSSLQIVCSTNTYYIGGSISGLASGQQVTLLNNTGDALTVTADGTFAFATPVAHGASYNVTVSTQPTGQTCSVANNSGAGAGVMADVSSVLITCSTNTYNIGGSLSGLKSGQQVTLFNNGGNALTLTANGSFAFTTPLAHGASYAVTVSAQPASDFQWCTVSSGTGTANNTISNVVVTCGPASAIVSTVPGTTGNLRNPRGMAYDSRGNLYITTYFGRVIKKLDPSGNLTTFAGGGGGPDNRDGQGTAATIIYPIFIVLGPDDNFYVSQCDIWARGSIRKIDATGYVSTFVGNLGCAAGLAFDNSGNLYFADFDTNKVFKINADRTVSTFAGSGAAASVDGQGTAASINGPVDLAFDSNGILYVSDSGGHKIRKIDPSGNVTTFAGSGVTGMADGQGTAATFNAPNGMAFDNGNLYVADALNHAIRKIDANGNVTTFIGTGSQGSTDGTKAVATFYWPRNLISDRRGGFYVAEDNNQLRRVSPAAP